MIQSYGQEAKAEKPEWPEVNPTTLGAEAAGWVGGVPRPVIWVLCNLRSAPLPQHLQNCKLDLERSEDFNVENL